MPKYDGLAYDPPAPVAVVTLHDSASGSTIDDVVLLLDTGADITLLPRDVVEAMGTKADTGSGYEVVSFDGVKSVLPSVELDMIFLRKAFRGKYLLIDAERGVLGRDVLASVAILLDGPNAEWDQVSPG